MEDKLHVFNYLFDNYDKLKWVKHSENQYSAAIGILYTVQLSKDKNDYAITFFDDLKQKHYAYNTGDFAKLAEMYSLVSAFYAKQDENTFFSNLFDAIKKDKMKPLNS